MEPTTKYDELSDTLYVSFAPGEAATGIELNEHILLRVNKAERRAIGLTIFGYSVLAQPTELGLRSLPLVGLADLSPDLRELALDILRTPPVQEILWLSAYTPSAVEAIPIASLKSALLARQAAYSGFQMRATCQ
ncbi:MAG: DUF2283 domain-containing protein [Blastocatellia bacterium]